MYLRLFNLENERGKYYSDSILDTTSAATFKSMIEVSNLKFFYISLNTINVLFKNGSHKMDKLLSDSLLEILNKGIIPGPDRAVKFPAKLSDSLPFVLDIGDGTITKDESSGKFFLKCENASKNIALGKRTIK